jgi:diaminopimelate decarboxylase
MFQAQHHQQFSGIPTPFYYYDLDLLRATLAALRNSSDQFGYHVHYAFKANTHDAVLEEIRLAGLGADCVSGNEVAKAIEVGFPSNKIVFAGVGKTDEEILLALRNDIFCFNCESIHELEVINEHASREGKTARVALRINPNVNANTHKYITTGLEENKFGISIAQLPDVLEVLVECSHLKLVGLHFHIGSQITDLTSFRNLCNRVNELQLWFENRNISLEHINVGGGLGVDYHHPESNSIVDFNAYFALFHEFLQVRKHQEIHFELGRSIVAQSGTLVAKALYLKEGQKTNFLILDAGMTELIRPALYQSYHKIRNLSGELENRKEKEYDVVGPICESTDTFGKKVLLPESKRGDLVLILTAGAYGEVMASNYNLRGSVRSVTSDELKPVQK